MAISGLPGWHLGHGHLVPPPILGGVECHIGAVHQNLVSAHTARLCDPDADTDSQLRELGDEKLRKGSAEFLGPGKGLLGGGIRQKAGEFLSLIHI